MRRWFKTLIRQKNEKKNVNSEPKLWKRNQNKLLRQKGAKYVGFRRDKLRKKDFQDVDRAERKLGPRCSKQSCRKSNRRHCQDILEDSRINLNSKFWNNMDWGEKKLYIISLVDLIPTKRPKSESGRRKGTFKYHLKIDNKRLQVCKEMFLNTFSLGEWSVHNWVTSSIDGFVDTSKMIGNVGKQNTKCDKGFVEAFLHNLPKLPSHYARKNTLKLNVDASFRTYRLLFNLYKEECGLKSKVPVSKYTFDLYIKKLNISIFHPRKDQCDVCSAYEAKNISDEIYQKHQNDKARARAEKEKDKEEALDEKLKY